MTKKEIDIIKRVVSVLNSVDYARYSDGRSKNYLEYATGAWKDERKLIAPIIFPKFLEQVLGFSLGENIGTQETASEGRDIPDYIPVDTRTHPFVFDCKGMDTDNLSKWYPQIKRYLEGQGLRYGILTNMRDLDVYTLESEQEIEAFNFNFVQLYKDYKENLSNILEKENTKHFLKFAERFKHISLTIDEKFKRIAEAKPWTGKETLNIDLLTKRLRHVVEYIHEDETLNKEALTLLKESDPDRAKSIVQEIELIASEIERGREVREASIEAFQEIIIAHPKSLLGRALDIFFYRVGYFTMTRLLLVRAWEDIGFIDQSLYDGGLAKWYENFNKEIRRVLKYAFGLAAERYKWLFNVDNNYSWYEPSDNTLIEVLYELSNFNLGKLNQDVLGTIYEEYIDKVDKKQKGQYYTPREIIEFIWNRVGFTNPKAFFWHIEGKRRPKFILDPATGSGGFLVEAARRIRDESGINNNDFQDLLDVRTSILAYIFGSEISIFPYYITEVNLLIQLTPVVKRMIELKKTMKESLPLGIVPVDALSLYNPESTLLPEEEYKFDHIRNLLPLESQKKAVFQKIKKEFDEKFSYCCANPPYISEKGNKEIFRSTLQRFPYWKEFYQGKMDYLYFFIILGLSKLRKPGERAPGGKLGFITTAYWPIADGASKLRKYILENAKIKEMIFFEDVKIFEYAKGQHNMVFILEKYAGKEREKERAENKIKIVRVLAKHQEVPGNTIREKLRFLTRHIQQHIDKNEWRDRYVKVSWSGVKQGELPKDGEAWNEVLVEQSAMDLLQKLTERGKPLQKVCDITRGLDSSADRVTEKNIGILPTRKVEQLGIKKGDGIFLLSENEKDSLQLLPNELEVVKPTYKNSNICPYFVDIDEKLFILYLKKDTDISSYPNILNHLEKFREIIESRGGHEKGELGWYSLHRPRNEKLLSSNKIVCSRWGEKGIEYYGFQTGEYYEGTDTWLIVPKESVRENVLYILGILNSALIKTWMVEKVQRRGYTSQSALFEIPFRCVDFDNAEDVQVHDEVVKKVKAIEEKVTELAGYSKYFKGIRLTRLKSEDSLPDINPESIVQAISPEKQFSLRTYTDIKITYGRDFEETKFILYKVGEVELTLEGPELKLVGKDRKVIVLKGKEELLQIISSILENHKGESWVTVKEIPLVPETAEDYNEKKQEILRKVMTLRNEIRELQTSIDAIVSKLYGISGDLGIME